MFLIEGDCLPYNVYHVQEQALYDYIITEASSNKRYMGGCQNSGPVLDPYYNAAPNIWATKKGAIILTTLNPKS